VGGIGAIHFFTQCDHDQVAVAVPAFLFHNLGSTVPPTWWFIHDVLLLTGHLLPVINQSYLVWNLAFAAIFLGARYRESH
jgi:hypothetical protein